MTLPLLSSSSSSSPSSSTHPPPPLHKIHTLDLTTSILSRKIQPLLTLLHHHLPASLELLRRIQFHLQSLTRVHTSQIPGTDSTAVTPRCFVQTTFPLDLLLPLTTLGFNKEELLPEIYTVAFIEYHAPSTTSAEECGIDAWVFNSSEVLTPSSSSSDKHKSEHGRERERAIAYQLLALLHSWPRIIRPPTHSDSHSHHTSRALQSHIGKGGSKKRTVALLRSLASPLARLLRVAAGPAVLDEEFGPGGPYAKFVIPFPREVDDDDDEERRGREGLHWDVPRTRADWDAVVGNNDIVGHRGMLEGLPCAALRCRDGAGGGSGEAVGNREEGEAVGDAENEEKEGELIAWAFLGTDGSVRTAFTIPRFRRRGLMRAVVRRLIRENLRGAFGLEAGAGEVTGEKERQEGNREVGGEEKQKEEAGWICGAHVSRGNRGSWALFEGLGGRLVGEAFWVRVDVGRAGALLDARTKRGGGGGEEESE